MGHHHSDLSDEGRKMSARFDRLEFDMLKQTYKDLARRREGDCIDHETFLQFFPLPGLLGERLFSAFDKRKTQAIDFEEFVQGIARLNRGTWDEQLGFVFEVFDSDASGFVTRGELKSLLNSLPLELLHENAPEHMSPRLPLDTVGSPAPGVEVEASFEEEVATSANFLTEVDTFTNNDLVEQAFRDCDFDHNDTLSFDQFKTWVLQYPIILNIMQSVLPYAGTPTPHVTERKSQGHLHLPRTSHRLSAGSDRMSRLASLPFHRAHSYNSLAGHSRRESHAEVSPPPPAPGRHVESDSDDFLDLGRVQPPNIDGSPMPSREGTQLNPYALRTRFNSFENNRASGRFDVTQLTLGENTRSQSAPIEVASPEEGDPEPLISTPPHGQISPRMQSLHRRSRSGSISCIDLRGIDNEHQVRNLVVQARNLSRLPEVRTGLTEVLTLLEEYESRQQGDSELDGVQKEGFLYKRGQHLHIWKQRWYLLSNNMLYYYAHKNDVRSRGVIFLTGCLVERLGDDRDSHGYFGFEIMSTYGNFRRVLYSTSEAQRDAWIHALQHAAQVIPIEEDYVLGGELGQGRFSHVLNCENKHTKATFAVKVIEKHAMEADERELLRTEIAIMKLVHHPHIIRMEAVYEDKEKIYIVMEKLEGGELFSRIVGRPTFSEAEAHRVMKPLVESVAYLHDMGIVHRDLKPENILCGEELEDLKIADFGLSKLVLPTDVMKMPCGTLSYVAPEVLTLKGYGKETDIWSVGVIMFLLLRGKLPFDGEDREDIIDQTINANLRTLMAGDSKWSRLSDEAQDLMYKMLEKDPKHRINARLVLRHPWMQRHRG